MTPAGRRAAAFALVCAAAAPSRAAAPPAQLSAACAGCHAPEGPGAGIPSLAGLDEAGIERSMLDYRSGRRPSQIMHVIASALSQAEIEAIAQFIAAHPKVAGR